MAIWTDDHVGRTNNGKKHAKAGHTFCQRKLASHPHRGPDGDVVYDNHLAA